MMMLLPGLPFVRGGALTREDSKPIRIRDPEPRQVFAYTHNEQHREQKHDEKNSAAILILTGLTGLTGLPG